MSSKVIYAGGRSVVELPGRNSQQLALAVVPFGTRRSTWKTIEWAAEDGGVQELEIAARIASARGTIGAAVRVLWYAELGAADLEFREPLPAPQIGSGTNIEPLVMPERGMRLRVNATRVKVGFRCELVGGVANAVTIAASVQPAIAGTDAPRFPKVNFGFAAERIAVPMFASEWRMRDYITGNALAAGTIGYTNTFGAVIGPVTLASLADWSPIPQAAATYQATAAHSVEFR